MCGKVSFNTKKAAHFALRGILGKGKRMRVYQCEKCFNYHLTSNVYNRKGTFGIRKPD